MVASLQAVPRKMVRFCCQAATSKSVYLVGTFNDWDPRNTPMTRNDKGEWVADVELTPGRYEFLFVVDGRWCTEPNGSRTCGKDSSHSRNGFDPLMQVNSFELCYASPGFSR